MDPRQRGDIEQWAEMAVEAAANATAQAQRHRRELDDHEQRLVALEENQRTSRIDADLEQRIVEALERKAKSEPPDSGLEFKDANGRRIRGSGWPLVIVAICVVLVVFLWRAPQVLPLLR